MSRARPIEHDVDRARPRPCRAFAARRSRSTSCAMRSTSNWCAEERGRPARAPCRASARAAVALRRLVEIFVSASSFTCSTTMPSSRPAGQGRNADRAHASRRAIHAWPPIATCATASCCGSRALCRRRTAHRPPPRRGRRLSRAVAARQRGVIARSRAGDYRHGAHGAGVCLQCGGTVRTCRVRRSSRMPGARWSGVRRLPADELIARRRRWWCCEGVSNADNVGGVFRNAAAFGAGCRSAEPVML